MACRTWPAVGVVLALVASGCTGGDPGQASPPSAARSGSSSTSTPSPTPQLVSVEGFQRLNALPEPVAAQVVTDNDDREPRSARAEVVQLTRSPTAVRVVIAWSEPSDGGRTAAPSRAKSLRPSQGSPYEIGLKLYDPAAATVTEPLRAADGKCLCSQNTGRFTDRKKQSLYWADFPAPAGDRITVLMGEQVPPFEDLPVTADQPPLTLPAGLVDWVGNAPTPTIGEGAGAPVVADVRRSVQTFGGAEDGQVGQNADVSLPSDVLFAFDSSTLSPQARTILAAAAPRLAVAAKGQRVQVVGHTDDQGSTSYNDALSLRRAQAVVAVLAPKVRAAGITLMPVGKGESEPLVPNVDRSGRPIEANRQRNRRVSFVFARARGSAATGIDVPKPLPTMPLARRTTASPKVTGSLASVLSQDGGTRVDVTRIQRRGEDLWVRLDFTAVGERVGWGSDNGLLGLNPYASNDTLANVRVVDPGARTIAPPLSYAAGACLCSENQGAGFLYPDPISLWAIFPAPKQSAREVTLRIPGAGQVVGVPIS